MQSIMKSKHRRERKNKQNHTNVFLVFLFFVNGIHLYSKMAFIQTQTMSEGIMTGISHYLIKKGVYSGLRAINRKFLSEQNFLNHKTI